MSIQPVTAISRRWNEFLSDLSEPPVGPRFRPLLWVALPLCLLIGITVLVRVTNFDFTFQKAIYSAGGNSWALGDHPFWAALYRYGTWLPAAVVLGSVIGLILSFSRENFRRWRKVNLFCILLFLTAPGVITNGLLKEYWGRPRPRAVEDLGGFDKFEPVLSIDRNSKGKSFPCGHATMGFYFLGGFFLFRRYRRKMAEGFLVFGLISGGLIGIARMAQGGHFFSDVIWAAAVCYFSALGLYYLLRLDRSLLLTGGIGKRAPKWARVGGALAGLVALGGFLLATPYHDVRKIELLNNFSRVGDLEVYLKFTVGTASIIPSERFQITRDARGFGVPTSQLRINYVEWAREDYTKLVFDERFSGWFSEVDEQLDVLIPWERTRLLTMVPNQARVLLTLPETPRDSKIQILEGKGEVRIDTNSQEIELSKKNLTDPSIIRISISDEFEGKLFIDGKLAP